MASWHAEFFRVLLQAEHRPFDWNGWTCFDFAATMYVTLTGRPDPRIAFGDFSTKRRAVVAMGRAGGPESILTSVLGEPIGPAVAQRGDIVLVEFGNGPQPAVCSGFFSFAPGARGLMPIKTLSALRAWEV